jgi:hypothetical protein
MARVRRQDQTIVVFNFFSSKSSCLMDYITILSLVFFELVKERCSTAINLAQDGFSFISLLVLEVLSLALRCKVLSFQNTNM